MTMLADDIAQINRNEAALELIHQAGGEVQTKRISMFEERDWEAEAYLDVWVGKYFKNIALHYHEILRAPHIGAMRDAIQDFSGAFGTGSPVAVVGAGPSLDKNVAALRDFPGLIIACDRAAKALTARGIRPDLVICVDPRPAVMAEMLNYPENRRQRLVLCVTADPEVAHVWRGPIYYHSTDHEGTQFFDRVLPELFPSMPRLFATGNVGNAAVQLANFVGASKIVLVGQDYAYTGDRMHCADWVRLPNGEWLEVAEDKKSSAESIARRTGKVTEQGITTYEQFLNYRDTLMKLVQEWDLDVTNATEGGILTGLPMRSLTEVIQELRKTDNQAVEARASLDKALGGSL